ncbi:MAG: hypothetical protein LBB23_01990 [Rickettsiales bacterium]|nr:hypothetical protein [Rickettsiales bacterium]
MIFPPTTLRKPNTLCIYNTPQVGFPWYWTAYQAVATPLMFFEIITTTPSAFASLRRDTPSPAKGTF